MATPSGTLTDMLARFGVKYPNAPEPTPALLAFMRGLGLTSDEAEDMASRSRDRIGRRTEDSRADVERAASRSKENVTADLVRRGVLRSGEANTRYARQAEDKAAAVGEIELSKAEGLDALDAALAQTQGGLRTRALETTLNTETQQDALEATNAARAASYKQQEESQAKWFERTQQAEDERLKRQIAILRGEI